MKKTQKANIFSTIYNIVFNSKGTALVCLLFVSGLAVFGVLSLVGSNKPAIALSVIGLVLLVNKVVSKIVE
jgi:uncharacterized membrane protein (DUF4010 family)|nr:MAG TPA: hypothetical protein [Caudoviricetes sp.]